MTKSDVIVIAVIVYALYMIIAASSKDHQNESCINGTVYYHNDGEPFARSTNISCRPIP